MIAVAEAVLWEEDTFDDAEGVVAWVVNHGGVAYISPLTQLSMGSGPAFQITITRKDGVTAARAGDLISVKGGLFTVHHRREVTHGDGF